MCTECVPKASPSPMWRNIRNSKEEEGELSEIYHYI